MTADPELELLSLLGPTPARIRDLMADMGFELQRDIYQLLKRLQKRGFKVRTELIAGSNERGACIDREDWPEAERAALAYVEGVGA